MFLRPFPQRVLTWSGPLLLLLCSALKIAEWHSEALWFASAHHGVQWSRLMAWRAASFLGGATLFAFWLGLNAHLAWRVTAQNRFPLAFFEQQAPRFIGLQDKLQLDQFRRRATIFVVTLFAWLAGLGCAARWATFLRAYHGQGLGQFDIASGYDLSFFLFQLPMWQLVSRFCLIGLVCALVLVLAIYFYEDSLAFSRRAPSASGANRHLALLWAALILWRGASGLLRIPEGFVDSGNVATRVFDAVDVRLGWTSLAFFAVSAPLLAIVSGLAIARRPRPRTFFIGLIWFAAAGNLPFLLPLVTGHSPQDPQWREALARHIKGTRRAWDLAEVRLQTLTLQPSAAFREVELASELTRPDSPAAIWPPQMARAAMNHDLARRGSDLRVAQVHLEREGATLLYRGVASLSAAAVASRPTWDTRRHRAPRGELLSINAARTGATGQAIFTRPEPVSLLFGPAKPSGERVFETRSDVESAIDDAPWVFADAPTSAAPNGSIQGVSLGSPLARLALAARFLDPQLLRARPGDVRVLWHRGAAERCAQIAPFLDWAEADVRSLRLETAAGSRLMWLVPGLVWSDDFPDSATPAAPGTAPLGANYGRQAALGVVDGQSGEVALFCLDDDEPYLALYRRAFPGLFAPLSSLSNPLRAALSPSSTLLAAQSMVWSRYHESDPLLWASRRGEWRALLPATPVQPSGFRAVASQNLPVSAPTNGAAKAQNRAPQWLVLPLAGTIGRAGAPGASSPLVALLGADESDFAARHGHVGWTQWQAARPISLPDAVAQPVQTLGPRQIGVTPAQISLAPRFDGRGRIATLLVATGEPATTSPEVGATAKSAAPQLTTRLWLAGLPLPAPKTAPSSGARQVPESRFDGTLSKARAAWSDLLSARRSGNWSAVARAEKRLDAALGAP